MRQFKQCCSGPSFLTPSQDGGFVSSVLFHACRRDLPSPVDSDPSPCGSAFSGELLPPVASISRARQDRSQERVSPVITHKWALVDSDHHIQELCGFGHQTTFHSLTLDVHETEFLGVQRRPLPTSACPEEKHSSAHRLLTGQMPGFSLG